jgi:TonB family protein
MKAFLLALSLGAFAVPAAAQMTGQTIRAKDGDVILLENNDKVKIVRRRHANLRILHNAEQRWVVLLADWLSVPEGGDGRVDWAFHFRDVAGTWPLGERWEGAAYLDEYTTGGASPSGGVGVTTTSGLLQLLNSVPSAGNLVADKTFADPSAMAVMIFRGSGGSLEQSAFDVAEQRALARIAQENAGGPVSIGPGMRSSVRMGVVETAPGAAGYPPPSAPIRVGGNIRQPAQIKHVAGVLPDAARRAGMHGMVILEIVIGADGKVTDAKVLRSIPLLDQAAIDAVTQWVYEPTLLNGQPVPVIMTATVNFSQ